MAREAPFHPAFSPTATVPERFLAAAQAVPDAVAVSDGRRALSYAELDRRSARLARRLRDLGAGPETLVAIAMERSIERIVGLLAILRAGGAYLPLDPGDPPARLERLVADAGARLALVDAAMEHGLPPRLPFVQLCPERERKTPTVPSVAGPPPGPAAENLAYAMFTSGSTGLPKGVAVPHRAVVRLVCDNPYARFGPDEVVLHLAPLAFDASTFEIWGALLHGARLELAPPGKTSLAGLSETLRRRRVTTLWLTAGLFHQMVDEQLEALGGLRQLLAGGDVLSPTHVRRLRSRWPAVDLINGYGPTENTTFTACHRVGTVAGGSLPIGRPIAHGRVAILGPGLRPVAAGEPGELCAAGHGLARGYLLRPGATADRFRPDPAGAAHGAPGSRLYRTGDLARETPGGDLEFLGRIDRQVKIRGFRIEPAEVEAALAAQPLVRRAAVEALPDAAGGRRLVAYVVSAPGATVDPARLREALARQLPEFMIPSAFVALAELPLTSQGKVDRRALPPPPRDRPALSTPWRAPGTAEETTMAGILAGLLGLDSVGVDDDLFELGGHSLVATRLATRVRDALGVELPLAEVFAHPTAAALAARAAALRAGAAAAEGPPWEPAPRDRAAPLSSAQRRIWFLQRLAPDGLAYNFQASLRLRGRLDIAALHRALAEIVRRHEIFRTTYPEVDGDPVAIVHPWSLPPLPRIDLAGLGAQGAGIDRILRRVYARPYRLDRLPLAYWALFRLGPGDHLLLHAEHHLLHDGWSFNVFLGELAALYRAYHANRPSPLAEPRFQFVDFAVWQSRWAESDAAAAQAAYWTGRLGGLSAEPHLPHDRPSPTAQGFRGDQLRTPLPDEEVEPLRRLARSRGATLFMALLAAFLTLLRRLGGRDDTAVGCGVANRRRPEVEGLIGMVINTVVLRVDLGGDPTFEELLARVASVAREAYAHQDLPLEKVVAALRPDRAHGRNPFFQVAFSAHDAPLDSLALPELTLEATVGLPNGSAKFDLNLVAVMPREQRIGREEGGGPLTVIWEFDSDLFDPTTVHRLGGHWRCLLAAAAATPGERLSRLPLWTAAQRHQALVEWADTAAEYPREASLDELFRARAGRRPDAVAVSWDGGALTYGELDRRAGALAGSLRRHGAGPGTRVAVVLPRSPELIVSLVAALRAGAAYAPLAPDDPPERLAELAASLEAAAVVGWKTDLEQAAFAAGVAVVEPWEATAAGAPPPAGPAGGEAPAYVLYTSGSTGTAKGVVVPQRAVARLVMGSGFARLGPEQVWLQLAPPNFDASTLEIWGALLHGARLALAPPAPPSLSELAGLLAREGVTALWLTAGLFHLMAEKESAALAGLEQLLAGGDVLSPGHVNKLAAQLPGLRLVDGYGPTENTTFTCCHRVRRPPRPGPVPIGRPIANTVALVVGSCGEPLPIGGAGELWTGGDGLALGYLGRPALTADRFVPNPWGAPGSRAYRTGDLVRWLPDGELEFLGRRDGQVKVRGFRVEPAEVEAHLRALPGVAACAVVAFGPPGDRELAGFWVRRGGGPDAARLRAALAARVPAYLVPSVLVERAALPLNAQGKVDRRALAREAVDRAAVAPAQGHVSPRSDAERLLAELWCELLGRPDIGVHDSFFDLGGHSLHATRHMHRLRERLGVDLPLRALYEDPTLERLALRIEAELLGEPAP